MYILRVGGNAVDAAASTGFALSLLQPHQNGAGGEVPTLVYEPSTRKVHAVSGHGVAPRAATIARMRELGIDAIPGDGFLPAVVPSLPGTWMRTLERFGTKRLAEILEPVIALARDGFPMYDALRGSIAGMEQRFRAEWPSSAEVYLPGGRVPAVSTLFRNPGWAATFQRLADADLRHARRADGFKAAYELFYGGIAREIVAFASGTAIPDASGRAHTGLLTEKDFEEFEPRFEEPVSAQYKGITLHKCGAWTQGPVFLQAARLAERFDLRAMGHNSADYIHTIVECLKLAFADRERYYGDPLFAKVPMDVLLSDAYTAERARLVDPRAASLELRPGKVPGFDEVVPFTARDARDMDAALGRARAGKGDTTKLEVIDASGMMVSATTSGGWLPSSPVIPGLGFSLGTRGQMFSLDPRHPNCLAPGKRPRTTLTPTLATRNGEPYLAFGSPGGDHQDQWALQFFLNVTEFGMSLQEAVEAPTVWTTHVPSSFYPRTAEPGSLDLESRIPQAVRDELARRGHRVRAGGAWAGGNTLAAGIDPSTGVRSAAASPRLDPAYAGAF
jgi:gamma-glutamyltranspeptidase / glutathione hydrolase